MRQSPPVDAELPPHSPYDERMLLSCLLAAPGPVLGDCERAGVCPDWFYVAGHREIFERAVDLRGDPSTDSFAVFIHRLSKNVKTPLAELLKIENDCPTATLFNYFAAGVRDMWLRRYAIRAHGDMARAAMDTGTPVEDLFNAADRMNLEMSQTWMATKAGNTRVVTPQSAANRTLDDIQRRFDLHQRNELAGVPTGFPDLDRFTGGFQAGELAVIAARPNQGKTALACSVAHCVASTRRETVVFVTLEMPPEALGRRLTSIGHRIPASRIRHGDLHEGDMPKLSAAMIDQKQTPIYYVDGVAGMTVEQIEREVRGLARMHAVRLVIVDYLQKVRSARREEKRTYEVAAVSGALKGMAASLNVAVLALAQLNRDSDKEGREPRVSDLADSSQIERDADLIAMIYRPVSADDPKGLRTKLIIGKQRDGETGVVDLVFVPEYAKFESAAKIYPEDIQTYSTQSDP